MGIFYGESTLRLPAAGEQESGCEPPEESDLGQIKGKIYEIMRQEYGIGEYQGHSHIPFGGRSVF